jgi:nitrite reductase/ring-hydroxylating ferredoxin subunit/uncharacterized membrane protein
VAIADQLTERAEEQLEAPLDSLGETLQNAMEAAGKPLGPPGQMLKNLLNGVWLGHPLHPAISDAPIGAWTTALGLDILGIKRGADAAVGLGILTAVPTALAGMADWRDTSGGPRRSGLLHALVNSLGLGLYVGSWFARRAGNRGLGVALSTAGWGLVFGGAYIGGDMVYRQGTGVSRNAFDPETKEWTAALPADRLVEGQLVGAEVEVDGKPLPVVFLKRGERIMALSAVCSHWGGPLAEGKLVDGDCVECPWHGSQFAMADGSVKQGPAAFPQPRFDTRVRDGQVEVRLAD